MIRRILAALAGTALAAGMLATMAPGTAGAAQASCKPSVTVTHSSNEVQAALHNTCGMRIAAYGNAWATGYRTGSFKRSGYSVACVDSSCTEGGGWSNGGWERLSGHVEHCTFGCGASAANNPLGYYHGTKCPTGPNGNPYKIRTINGTNAPWIYMKQSGAGNPVVSGTSGRLLYWTFVGCTINGWPMGYWKNYKHEVLASTSTCGTWTLASSTSDNGTVSIDRLGTMPDGTAYTMIGSRYCNKLWKRGRVTHVWASNDQVNYKWVPMNLARPRSGLYVRLRVLFNQSRSTAALARRGCTPSISGPVLTPDSASFTIQKGCDESFQAYARFGPSDFDYGTPASSGTFRVCDDRQDCDAHPDGSLQPGSWGYRAAAPAAHTTALVKGQCECVHWNAYAWGMKSEWTDNPGGFYERAYSYDRNNKTGATTTIDGPWRVNSFIYSNAPAPGGYVMVKGGWQQKDSAGGKITTHQTYP